MKNKSQIEQNVKPVLCFAVTDQFNIIPLKEVGRKVYPDNFIMISTEIIGKVNNTGHCQAHHKAYFASIWLTKEGSPDKQGVFLTKSEANAYALTQINDSIAHKQSEIGRLKTMAAEIAD